MNIGVFLFKLLNCLINHLITFTIRHIPATSCIKP